MRAKIKKPMTTRRLKQFLSRLQELHSKGHDVNACLDAATDHQWLDVYPLKQEAIPDLRPKKESINEQFERDRKLAFTPESIAARERCKQALKVVR